MKKIVLSLSAFLLLVACTDTSEPGTAGAEDTSVAGVNTGPADTAQARRDLDRILDSIDNAFKRKDISYIDNYMAKDGIYAGTDPGEIWTYEEMRNYALQSFKDTTIKSYDFTVSRRIIRVNGASANLMEQYLFPGISQKVMARTVGHARYENGRWIVDMYTYNIIPKNEDLLKMDKVL